MTATAVKDDQVRTKPTSEQVDTYARRESELRQRFLKGILDVGGVLALLQQALELVRGFINCNVQPEIPNWAKQDDPIIRHIPGGVIDPANITPVDVFQKDEPYLEGDEFMRRAQAVPGAMNACALDFYAKPENWKCLQGDVDVLVFANTEFRRSGGRRCVRCLCRDGAEWNRYCGLVDYGFGRNCRVAALASPQASVTKPS